MQDAVAHVLSRVQDSLIDEAESRLLHIVKPEVDDELSLLLLLLFWVCDTRKNS